MGRLRTGSDLRLVDRVRVARQLIDDGCSPETAWFSLLKRWVLEHGGLARFADVLAHPVLDSIEPTPHNALQHATIAEMSVVHEFLLASGDMAEKRRQGQFYTPDDVARFMVSKSDAFPLGVWLDPCCGVGNLTYWLVSRQPNPEAFLLQYVRCSDLSGGALLSARIILAVAFQDRERDLFSALEPNFVQRDYLSGGPSHVPGNLPHDYVLMNPPYVGVEADSYRLFRSARSRDLFAYFTEKALRTSRGVIAITPQSFTHGRRHQDLRSVMLERPSRIQIFCFDNVPDNIFRGLKFGSENSNSVNSTRAAVFVSKACSESETPSLRITPLIRWTTRERTRMFDMADQLLAEPTVVNQRVFPKIYRGLEALYDQMESWEERLSDLLVDPSIGTIINVPTTPRYFISAVRRNLSRSSITQFAIADSDVRRVYLTLNSSLAYLWWRIHDGGMTLSKATLMSMPMPPSVDFGSDQAICLEQEFLASEATNLVFKRNSGKNNENVKHPLALVERLNNFVAPDHATRLIEIHSNTLVAALPVSSG